MECPACRASISATDLICPSCGINLRPGLDYETLQAQQAAQQAAPSSQEYRVLPYTGPAGFDEMSDDATATIAAHLEQIINREAASGWDFLRIEQITALHTPGLWEGFANHHAAPYSYGYNMLIFRKKRTSKF